MTVLVIDDEPSIREVVSSYLKHAGFRVLEAQDGKSGLELFTAHNPDFVILDLMLPDRSGEQVCQIIRRRSQVPILMLSAKVTEEEKINGFQLGADDYLTKPFSPRELLARVEAIRKRSRTAPAKEQDQLSSFDGSLVVSRRTRECLKNSLVVNLTPTEYRLLCHLMDHPGQVFSRNQLAESALGEDFQGFDRTVDAHIKNLRMKLEEDTAQPFYIETVIGFGYRWREHC